MFRVYFGISILTLIGRIIPCSVYVNFLSPVTRSSIQLITPTYKKRSLQIRDTQIQINDNERVTNQDLVETIFCIIWWCNSVKLAATWWWILTKAPYMKVRGANEWSQHIWAPGLWPLSVVCVGISSLPLSPLSSRKCLSCGLTHCVSWWLSWDQLPSYPAPTWCNYQEKCCSATTRLNFLYSQLDFFPQARTLHAQSKHPHSLDNLWIKVVIIFDKRKKVDIDMM